MKNLKETLKIQELSAQELEMTNGGGDADDIAYNIVYVGLRVNPMFWLMKYNEWVANKITSN